jgi:amidohydrolase
MDIENLKSQIVASIDESAEAIFSLSRRIHANPEMGFKEVQASAWITEFMENQGFNVHRGICKFPTAFRASYGKGKPAIAFLAEYDALPGLGHGCGHNLISAAGVAAALGSKKAVDVCGGTILLIGTPAEELYAGKQVMAQRGAFKDLDAVMMVHPDTQDIAVTHALACQRLDIEFFGKAAHAAGNPHAGINALEAMVLSFNAIDALRQHLPPKAMVHGIITSGGSAANVVPDYSAGNFIVRAADLAVMEVIKQKVLNCFTGAALATGAQMEYKWEDHFYAPVNNNLTICRTYVNNLKQLGRKVELDVAEESFGSTDFGNVSQLVPGMHAQIGVATAGTALHSTQFVKAAISDRALKSTLLGGKAMALTAADLLSSPQLLRKVSGEFNKGS